MINQSTKVSMIVGCAFMLQSVDGNVLSVAVPQIAINFGTEPTRISSAIISYLLTVAVFLPISGWLADRYGARATFIASILVFALGSILCGFSINMWTLTAARAIQGIGGAMIMPVGRLVLLRSVPKSEFVASIALVSIPLQIGQLLGPPLGGFITTYTSWRWIFFINVPIACLGIILILRNIENFRGLEVRPLDFGGFLLSGSALACLLFGLEAAGGAALGLQLSVATILGGIFLSILAVRHLNRHPHPLLDLSLMKLQNFRIIFLGGTMLRLGLGAVGFILSLLFQSVFQMTAFQAGVLILGGAFGQVLMGFRTRSVIAQFGFRTVLLGSTLLSATSIVACIAFTPTTPISVILAVLIVNGLAQMLAFTCLNTLIFADIEPARMSTATSFSQLSNQLGIGTGVAFSALVLTASQIIHGAAALSATEIRDAIIAVVVFHLAAILIFRWLALDAGHDLSGHKAALQSQPD
ncbi:MAG TPA: MFS transporter [Beijerinckiaceae bacterium]|jgi:EmrB/QacA subfamily drug resistance transporter|nr:MFS transporter [Beijerinckiaceae bacterium]